MTDANDRATSSTSSDTTSDALMVSEMPDRYDLIGLDVVNRNTGEVENFIRFTRDEIDFVGMVESREKSYDNSEWTTRRVYRTLVRPADTAKALASARDIVALVESIHNVYRRIVMDTAKERALHDRHVATADAALRLAKERLNLTLD
jgi:hypothetical protein